MVHLARVVLLAVGLASLGPGCAPVTTPGTGTGPAGSSSSVPQTGGKADSLTIGGYSVIKEVFHNGLLPAFARQWKARSGRDVTFVESYEASGAQARKISQAGFEADLAALSLEDDMDLLAQAGLVKPGWNAGPTHGMLTHSLVVIGYRKGNPKGIQDWPDLARPGVGVLYPDPKTSGGARWNVNAIYGYAMLASRARHGGKADPKEVGDFLRRVQGNVINMDASGRQSVATFERGTGDVLVTYENELLLRRKQGREIPYVIPPSTLLIESPVAIVDRSVDRHRNREVAEALLAFLRSPEGQGILGQYGFRPIDPSLPDTTGRPQPPKLFTMSDLGGWSAVKVDVYGAKGLWTSVFADLAGGK